MARGTVKAVLLDRGFGFVRPNEPGRDGMRKDLFFHVSSLVDLEFDEQLLEQSVEYDVATRVNSDRGPRAENVRPLE
jgi:cold shock CspA family protein